MERMLMEYLVNSLWQAPLLAGGAWLVLRAGKPGPRVQHGVWVAALVLMVAMPLLSLRGMARDASAPVAAPVVAVPMAAMSVVAMPEVESVGVQAAPTVARSSEMQNVTENSAPWWRMREAHLSAGATHRVVELYLAVMVFAMTRLLWSWIVASRMVSEASLVALNEAEMSLLSACCARLRVRQPRVLASPKTASPLIVGVLRPVLLLPEQFAHQDDRELEAVWWHELAHVRRRDYLANLVCRVWALPVAYHPVTQAVERRVRQTREMVCDQIAAEGMESPVGYARCLVGLAKRMQHGCSAQELLATGMFGGGVLEERVMELIGKKTVESLRMRVVRTASGVAMLAMVMGAAAMFHVTPTMAQVAVASVDDGGASPLVTAPLIVAEPAMVPRRAETPAKDTSVTRSEVVARRKELRRDRIPTLVESARRDAIFLSDKSALSGRSIIISGGTERLLAIADSGPLVFIGPMRIRGAMVQGSVSGVVGTTVPVQAQDVTPTPKAVPVEVPSPAPHPKVLVQPQPAAAPQTPIAPKAPAPPMAPMAPMAPKAPKAPLPPMAPLPPLPPKAPLPPAPPLAPAGKAQVDPNGNGLYLKLDPKWQLKLDAEMAAEKEKLLKVQERMNSPEFKKQMEDAQRAAVKMNSPEFKQKLMDAQVVATKMNSPEFREKIEEARKQMRETMEKMNTPEFKQQMEDAQKAAMKVNNAEFKEQMKEAQKQMKEAMEKMNSPEFKKQMQEIWVEPKAPVATESH